MNGKGSIGKRWIAMLSLTIAVFMLAPSLSMAHTPNNANTYSSNG